MKSELLIRVQSFSYLRDGLAGDPTGHGGGFVFDCRGLPNPGRDPELAPFCGFDPQVVASLEGLPDVERSYEAARSLVASTAEAHAKRGFRDLSVAFGCTGGRHRSVYFAERLAADLAGQGYAVRRIHWQLEREEPQRRIRPGMILAAGFGTRLRPLTETTPKALVPAAGRPMLEHVFDALRRAGVSEIVVNGHHHLEQVADWVRRADQDWPRGTVRLSEEHEILGTGGGLRAAARWLHGPAPVLLHNVDVYSEIDLAAMPEPAEGELAVLAVQEREASSYLLVDETMAVVGLRGAKGDRFAREPSGEVRPWGFTGVHLIAAAMLERLAQGEEFGIIDAYLRMIERGGVVRAWQAEGAWFDMGSPAKLERLESYLLEHG